MLMDKLAMLKQLQYYTVRSMQDIKEHEKVVYDLNELISKQLEKSVTHRIVEDHIYYDELKAAMGDYYASRLKIKEGIKLLDKITYDLKLSIINI